MGLLAHRIRLFANQLMVRRQDRLVILTQPPELSEYPAVFMAGCPRSGTSLVRRIVDSHSRIACPPESHFLIPLLRMLADRRSQLGFAGMGFEADAVTVRTRAFAERFFAEYAQAHNKPRWVDKTPFHVDHLDDLAKLFGPTTKFVLIIRHGLDVARSMTNALSGFLIHELGAASGDAVGAARVAAGYWADKTAKMMDFQERRGAQCHVVRYEALVDDPPATVRALFEFIGEAYEPGTLDFNATHHDTGLEDGRVRSSRKIDRLTDTWRSWDRDQLAAASGVAGPMLDRLGYPHP